MYDHGGKALPGPHGIQRLHMKPSIILSSLGLVGLALIVPPIVLRAVTPVGPDLTDAPAARIVWLPGGPVRTEETGSGDAVVFLHGFNGHLGQWDPVWGALRDTTPGRLIRVDIPGFGRSVWDADDFGLPVQAQHLVRLLDSLEVDKAILVGVSMGGSLAAWTAAEYPERVSRLLLMAPSGFTDGLIYPGLFGRLVRPGRLNRGATHIARSRGYRWLFPNSKALQALTVTATYGPPWVAVLGSIRAPTLVLWSRGDLGVSFRNAPALTEAVTESRLLWLDKASGHLLEQTRPDLVAWTVRYLAAGGDIADIADTLPEDLLRSGDEWAPTTSADAMDGR
jgi:pimeloyl-ACP methyl ester carboxylesterase